MARASINNGLIEDLKHSFSYVISIKRPLVVDKEIKDPFWLAGFAAGEASFIVQVCKSSVYKTGMQVQLRFQITQHSRDVALMRSLEQFLNCGDYCPRANKDAGDFIVTIRILSQRS